MVVVFPTGDEISPVNRLVLLTVPADMWIVAVIRSLLEMQTDPVAWYPLGLIGQQEAAQLFTTIEASVIEDYIPPGGSMTYPKSVTMWHDESIIVAGNPLTRLTNASQQYAIYSFQNTPALNDEFKHEILLDSGSYTFSMLYVADLGAGKIEWFLDSTSLGIVDMYGGSALNLVATLSFSVITPGPHTLTGRIVATTGGGYSAFITKFWIN